MIILGVCNYSVTVFLFLLRWRITNRWKLRTQLDMADNRFCDWLVVHMADEFSEALCPLETLPRLVRLLQWWSKPLKKLPIQSVGNDTKQFPFSLNLFENNLRIRVDETQT